MINEEMKKLIFDELETKINMAFMMYFVCFMASKLSDEELKESKELLLLILKISFSELKISPKYNDYNKKINDIINSLFLSINKFKENEKIQYLKELQDIIKNMEELRSNKKP